MTNKQVGYLLITFFILALAIFVLLSMNVHKAQAHNDHCFYECHKECYGEQCITPTPTVTPTPDVTPEVTEAPNPGGPGDGLSDGRSSDPGATQAPAAASCTVPFAPAIVTGYKKNTDGSQTYSWWQSTDGGEYQSVVYGYAPEQALYGVMSLPADQTSLTIYGLDTTKVSWFQVWTWRDGCAEKSNWFN